jgi:predicted Holliday junction resolvase-like endonuclease
MSGLQEAFYIIAIVFMGVMFVLVIALVVAVFVIRSKINHIQRTIESRINTVTTLAEKGGELAGLAAAKVARRARKAVRKAKK